MEKTSTPEEAKLAEKQRQEAMKLIADANKKAEGKK